MLLLLLFLEFLLLLSVLLQLLLKVFVVVLLLLARHATLLQSQLFLCITFLPLLFSLRSLLLLFIFFYICYRILRETIA